MKLVLIVPTLLISSLTYINVPQVNAVSGADFNAGRIFDDSVFFNSSGMDINTIQTFLNSKVPVCDTNHPSSNPQYQPPFTCLKDYREDTSAKVAEPSLCNGIAPGNKSAAQIIFEVSQSCGVSAKALIVLLEKEQSLITDTWPWSIQYRSATGYGCPDTAPCDVEYYGFFNQVYNAARQFKRYARDESSYRYRAYRENYIQYNPDANCGGSNVIIQNQATAGLYNYTPYQPNPATKAAAPGQTVNCGAYGNINFWRIFNNWFGATTGEGFSLMTTSNDNGDTRQWVVYKGIKRHVPSAEILRAWRLDQIPLIQTSGLYLGAIPTYEQPLDRLMRPTGTLDVYFVDNGMSYRINSPETFAAWGLNPAAIVDVSEDLGRLPANQGDITYAVKTASDPRVFFMDGGVLRHIQNSETLEALEGVGTHVSLISQDYFTRTSIQNPLSSPRVSDAEGNSYIISNRSYLKLPDDIKNLFPWSPVQLNASTFQRMGNGTIQPYIRADGDSKVYLVDKQQRHHITDPNVLSAWQPSNRTNGISTVSRGVVNLISNGAQITDYYANDGSTNFLIDKSKKSIPLALVSAYTGSRNVYSASQNLLGLFPDNGTATNFVKVKGQVQSYLITNSGVLRHITSTEKFNLWAGAQTVTEITSSNASSYTLGGGISAFVSDGVSEFVMDGGSKSLVSGPIKNNWKLSNPDILNDGTLNNFTTNAPLSNELQNNSQYFLISDGVSYGTVDTNIASIWLISNAQTKNLNLIKEFLSKQPLTRFVLSKNLNDTRLFVADKGVLYHLTPEHALNLGSGGPYMYVNPELISNQPITLWGGILIKNDSGAYYVIDGGGKRTFSNSIIFDHWRRLVPLSSVPTVTDGFTNTLSDKGFVERAIKGSAPAVYSADSIKKHWIRSTQTYTANFGVYTSVTDHLINALPVGQDIQ